MIAQLVALLIGSHALAALVLLLRGFPGPRRVRRVVHRAAAQQVRESRLVGRLDGNVGHHLRLIRRRLSSGNLRLSAMHHLMLDEILRGFRRIVALRAGEPVAGAVQRDVILQRVESEVPGRALGASEHLIAGLLTGGCRAAVVVSRSRGLRLNDDPRDAAIVGVLVGGLDAGGQGWRVSLRVAVEAEQVARPLLILGRVGLLMGNQVGRLSGGVGAVGAGERQLGGVVSQMNAQLLLAEETRRTAGATVNETRVAINRLGAQGRTLGQVEDVGQLANLLLVGAILVHQTVNCAQRAAVDVPVIYHHLAFGAREGALRALDVLRLAGGVHRLVIDHLGVTTGEVWAVTTLEHLLQCTLGTSHPDQWWVWQLASVQEHGLARSLGGRR